ncbi:hypothetical protein BRE01_05110 [Brevibacillus reuszeri]|uniref:Uncharacterized protein n=1 Tax=Brevibacillus reuszeri TaxID=54915 RepID=A0A0K9YRY6_9BACL|nr:hypothetical protein [Brevibacillus reuszeri]KNB70955.1 hypothetical protein ADS79_19160 [Brevibacillus reuszeri]MED1857363.1 hypothetical protein [Brevibacillus reuszeri]GED66809.1 hypothetical protein BRE01_05110 [Brevibacillus reuszeri]
MGYFSRLVDNLFSCEFISPWVTEDEFQRNIRLLQTQKWFLKWQLDEKHQYLLHHNHHVASLLIDKDYVQQLLAQQETQAEFLHEMEQLKNTYEWEKLT